MSGLWDAPGVPHKGWTCVDMEDLEEAIATCEMCGQEEIRYLHYMTHPEYPETLAVGCICAGKMEASYENAKQRERNWRNRAGRKQRWLSREWKVSQSGNPYLNVDGYNIVIFPYKKGRAVGKFGFRIEDPQEEAHFSKGVFDNAREAQLASFDDFWKLSHPDG